MIERKPPIGVEEIKCAEQVLQTGWLSRFRAGTESDGKVRELEDLFCDYFDVKYAVAMNSATSCLHVACKALNVKEVYTTPLTFSASASCVKMAGGEVKFSDIEDTYYNIDPNELGKCDTIIAVHLHGHPAELGKLSEKSNRIIEDCSQALGARYKGRLVGTIGDCGVFSFNQWKHISSGEGGMLITNNDDIARYANLMRNHGEVISDVLGYNYRMTELSAAVLIPQFKRLDSLLAHRIEMANYLTQEIKDYIDTPKVAEGCTHVYYTYPIKTKNRARLQMRLASQGYYFGSGGYKPLHLFEYYGGKRGDFPVAERMYDEMMFTDIIRHSTTIEDIDRIAEIIKSD